MNFIKRAFINLTSKFSRSILLMVIFSAILIFVLAGLTIRSAALSAIENAKKEAGATATLQVNREAMFSKQTSDSSQKKPDPTSFKSTPVPLDDAEKIAKLDNVKSYNYLSSTSAGAGDGITPISSAETTEASSSDSSEQNMRPGGGGEGGGAGFGPGNAQGDFSISGVLASSLASDFAEGTAKIISGEGLTESDKGTNNVLIEKTLAESNDLNVGDTFTISNPTDETVTYEVTIKGIYETSSSGDSMGMNFNFMNPSNTIYSSYTLANTLKGSDYDNAVDSVSYTLTDPAKMDTFVSEAKKLIDTETYSIQTNDQMYQQMLQPLNNVASFAQNIVLLVTVAGIVILSLIVILSIKERRYEIGVLLSLGESRMKVILQFFTELMVVMMCSLVIASFTGNLIGKEVGEQLLAQQTEQTTTTSNGQGQGGPGRPEGPQGNRRQTAATTKEIEDLDVQVTVDQLVQLGGIGLGICFLSVLVSSIGIIRLQPKSILTA